ncbi:FABR030Wp [Eremothecium gossypii FDAG1]|nr:FABR030Wp [Eremothecium gossypii FDAG1]
MSIQLLKASEGSVITGYCVTNGLRYVIFAEVTYAKSKGVLKLFSVDNEKTITFNKPVEVGTEAAHDDAVLNKLAIIKVPVIRKNKVEKTDIVVINAGDGIQLMSLEQLFGLDDGDGVTAKWQLSHGQDRILSFEAKATTNGVIEIWFCTRLGQAMQVKYSVSSDKFHSFQQLMEVSDDSLNCMATGSEEYGSWEAKLGPLKAVAMACFDNSIYWLHEGTLERQSILSFEQANNNTLTSVAYVTVKRLTTTYVNYYCGSVTNIGCIMYKRSTRGDWDVVHTFRRPISKPESSPLLNCALHFDNVSEITIVSGTECGILCVWRYDYKAELELAVNHIKVGGESDLVHGVQLLGSQRAYFLCNRSELRYVDL